MITSVIFDLDDTLCDYSGAKRRAFAEIGRILKNHSIDADRFLNRYTALEPKLFRDFADGKISKAVYRERRFGQVLAEFSGAPIDLARELNEIYLAIANGQVFLFDDVVDTIQALKVRGIRCALLTNGPSDGQRTKIKQSGIGDFIEHIFISEELGVAKPDCRSFQAVADALGQLPHTMVMVGDSVTDDIQGAEAAGMLGVLIDRSSKTYGSEVRRIKELYSLIEFIESAPIRSR